MADQAAGPKKGNKLVFVAVCVACVAGGAAVPMVVDVPSLLAKGKAEGDGHGHGKAKGKPKAKETVAVPIGDVVVNLAEERTMRFLKIKAVLLVDTEAEKDVTELLTKHKALVRNELISHLHGKAFKDVSGTVGVNRLQRELQERVEDVLYPDGHSPIHSLIFEDFVIQ